MLNVLFIGDIIGNPGRTAVKALLPGIISKNNIDFVIANGENSAGGNGVTRDIFDELMSCNIDMLTSGNHIWDKKEVFSFIQSEPRLLRPANYPDNNPGAGFGVYNAKRPGKSAKIGVISIMGRVFLPPADDPFKAADKALAEIKKQTNIIFVDIHAEATSEKQAMGFYLDGRVSAVIGTHTHVQTADEKILSAGTGYITDAGMTGPFDSVIGMKKEIILKRFVSLMPERFEPATGDIHINAVMFSVDESSGKTMKVERLDVKYES
jgi:metallophosphoesterase (TIGR00282 family)